MKSYYADYNKGFSDEIVVLPIINKYFNRNIKKTEGRYNKFDFEDDESGDDSDSEDEFDREPNKEDKQENEKSNSFSIELYKNKFDEPLKR
jgi:hypothetical protein